MTKIKKIYKEKNEYVGIPKYLDVYDFREFLRKHTGYDGFGRYKLSISFKVGKRRKLKKVSVEYYNSCYCDCCGPSYVAEIL